MTDVVDPQTRSRMMSGIRAKDTAPEHAIRSMLHSAGFRFRLHYSALPGKPDIVLPKYRAIILVNGCFWHGHACHLFKWPSSRPEFWRNKISATQERDRKNIEAYKESDWRVMVVWECALRGKNRLEISNINSRIQDWLLGHDTFSELIGQESPAP